MTRDQPAMTPLERRAMSDELRMICMRISRRTRFENVESVAPHQFSVLCKVQGEPLTIGALADAYIADLETKNWLAAGGDDNRVVFIKRREAGGCDGLQMVAFYDTTKTAVAELPGYLGFATIPGDVCATAAAATPPAAAGTPQQ